MIFKNIRDVKSLEYDSVVKLGDKNSKTLGFLPREAFAAHAKKGQIIAAFRNNNSNEVLGYILFRITFNKVTIVHLCIDDKHRGNKTAFSLVQFLKDSTKQYDGIKLSCRNDYGINHVWESFNFVPIREKTGRSLKKLPLTIWWYPHNQNNLFSQLSDYEIKNKIVAVIDMNIFLDIKDERENESLALKSDWLLSEAILYFTREIYVEINRGKSSEVKSKSRELLNFFKVLPFQVEEEFESILNSLKKEFPAKNTNDSSDLRHLAYSISGNAQFFITRDKELLKKKNYFKKFDLIICRPSDFITQLDENIQVSKYKPKKLIGTNIESKSIISSNVDLLTKKFVMHSERMRDFERVIRLALSSPNDYELVTISKKDEILAFMIFDRSNKNKLVIPIFRFLNNHLRITLSKHLLYKAILKATVEKRALLEITENFLDDDILNSIRETRFLEVDKKWKKINVSGIHDFENIKDIIPKQFYKNIIDELNFEEHDTDFEFLLKYNFERYLSPVKIMNFNIPTFIIPIKPKWAEQLFNDKSDEKLHLFESQNELLLNRENVYYRSPIKGSLCAPSRILWYISENPITKEKGHIKAMSYIDEIFVDDAKKLFKQFEQLGIYKWKDIENTSDSNKKIMAFIFSDTELFNKQLNLKYLREIFLKEENKKFMVISPTRIKTETFLEIYKKGTSNERGL